MVSLDFDLPLDGIDEFEFGSTISLFDYDIAFWHPATTLRSYSWGAGKHMGRDSLSEHESARLKRDVDRRRTEFFEFVSMGRKLVVFLPGDTRVYVDTGERTYSGTGRNRATTRIVTELDLMRAMPTNSLRMQPGSGLEMVAASDLMAPLLRQMPEAWAHRCLVEKDEQIRPLAYVKGTNKMVAGMIREKKNKGLLLLLPDFFPDGAADDEDEKESPQSRDSTRTEALVAWLAAFDEGESVPEPDWSRTLRFPTQVERQKEIAGVETSICDARSGARRTQGGRGCRSAVEGADLRMGHSAREAGAASI